MINFFHHRGDNDGWGAAWIVHYLSKFLPTDSNLTDLGKTLVESQVKYLPYEYGDPIPDIDAKQPIIMVDISLPENDMIQLAESCEWMTIVDHHKTQYPIYMSLMERYPDKVTVIYTEERCGAYLFWQACLKIPPVQLIRYIDDHDRWANQLPNTKEIRSLLQTLGDDMRYWDTVAQWDLMAASHVEKGYVIQRFITEQIKAALPKAHLLYLPVDFEEQSPDLRQPKKYKYVVALALPNCIKGITSELGHALASRTSSGIGVTYFPTESGKWYYSLRGVDGVRVDEIAKFNGGGGHPSAAGFVTSAGPESFMEK